MCRKTVSAIRNTVADNNAGRSAGTRVVSNVPNIPHHNRARRKAAGLNTAAVVAHNLAAAVVLRSRPAAIAKAAMNGIFPAAPPATSGVSARDESVKISVGNPPAFRTVK